MGGMLGVCLAVWLSLQGADHGMRFVGMAFEVAVGLSQGLFPRIRPKPCDVATRFTRAVAALRCECPLQLCERRH